MTTLQGKQLIAGAFVAHGSRTFTAHNPATGRPLEPVFFEATAAEADDALQAAAQAFAELRDRPGPQLSSCLGAIADEIEALGPTLIELAHAETGLPLARLEGERARTVNQTRAFAAMINEGSWVAARIDRGDPQRKPLPKPDVRAMLTGMGPVVVFGASNFPLAISVAGTDTISALAAGCPVVVKAHPAHPGTSELVAGAITRALARTGLPAGAFSMLHGAGHEIGLALTRHPHTRAVAFTGSLRGGRALFDAAVTRPDPIPVYAEMGSLNPVFLLPGALAARGDAIAGGFVQSLNMGTGQFCTNPGLVFGHDGPSLDAFLRATSTAVAAVAPATMLHAGILAGFENGTRRIESTPGVEVVGRSQGNPDAGKTQAGSVVFATQAPTFAEDPRLHEEVFGPASLVVRCRDGEELLQAARALDGHLTASVHGTEADLAEHRALIDILATKVGRIIFNGFGTGIEVCAAMNHGGPYPAATFSQFTSIGHASIYRFARPVAYQGFPDAALPPALQNANPLGIWRVIDNQLSRERC